jgi:hypothetical protein
MAHTALSIPDTRPSADKKNNGFHDRKTVSMLFGFFKAPRNDFFKKVLWVSSVVLGAMFSYFRLFAILRKTE